MSNLFFKLAFCRYFKDVGNLEFYCLTIDFDFLAKGLLPSTYSDLNSLKCTLNNILNGDPRRYYIVLKSSKGRGCTLLITRLFGRIVCLNPNFTSTYGFGVKPFLALYSKFIRDFNILPF